MVFVLISGRTGTGKTLTMTRTIILLVLKYGFDVYANYHIFRLGKRFHYISTPDEIDDIREGIFAGDDFWQWIDARCSPSRRNIKLSNIMAKARKRRVKVYITTQDYYAVERRLRVNAEMVMMPELNGRLCYVAGYDGQDLRHGEETQIFDYYYDAKPIFNLYDTEEEIDSAYETDTKTRYAKVEEYSRDCVDWMIEENIDKVTKTNVRLFTYEKQLDADDKMIEDIFGFIKNIIKFDSMKDRKLKKEKVVA